MELYLYLFQCVSTADSEKEEELNDNWLSEGPMIGPIASCFRLDSEGMRVYFKEDKTWGYWSNITGWTRKDNQSLQVPVCKDGHISCNYRLYRNWAVCLHNQTHAQNHNVTLTKKRFLELTGIAKE